MSIHKISGLLFALLLLMGTPATKAGEVMLSGFLQGLYGGGLDSNNPTASDLTASESRLQMRLESYSEGAEFFGRLDFVYDDYNNPGYDFELREGYAKFKVGNNMDFKIGRQIITWGTGDLIFINDLFAKDYRSFFTGRDDQYLKAPQNTIRAAWYTGPGTFSLIYTPRFTPNRIPTGERLSYFNPMVGEIVGGEDNYFEGRMPEAKFRNGEIAARFSRYFGSADVALYFYHGFYKNPVGMDMANLAAYYPRLNVFGASARMPVLGGIAWLESGYFDSRDDSSGYDPTVPNSSISSMIGFERQLTSTLTANLQYQNRTMLDYDNYTGNLPPGSIESDEMYHLLTSRLTKLMFMETLTLSGFAFYSPSDEDFYGRFSINYKYTDALTLTLGANIFDGNHEYTDFGAFQKNDNIYAKITYGY
ncbi:MAG: hypothetical protein CVT49_08005 [candidate division Zixibacteria bacterium HGW-Zixibacteria-1]|nr:MAG: hypothetical protein CVT49_08005 [candidate division Zixibacteria bacterium HGW-Zixibacteria-1]